MFELLSIVHKESSSPPSAWSLYLYFLFHPVTENTTLEQQPWDMVREIKGKAVPLNSH